MTCFKKINGVDNVYFRCAKCSNGFWNIASDKDTLDESEDVFYDDEKIQYYLRDIADIGINNQTITCLYVFNGRTNDEELYPNKKSLKITNEEEVAKVIDYLNRQKCDK